MPNKLTYEQVKEYIESFGYTLISKEYINSSTKIEVMCPKGHLYEVRFNDFKSGYRCKICSMKGINKKYNYEYVKKYFENFNYKLITSEYNSCDEYLDVQCPNGHDYKTTFSNFKSGYRCKECAGVLKLSYSAVVKSINNAGYKLLTPKREFKNVNTHVKIQCNNGHIYSTKLAVFNRGYRCPYCSKKKVDIDMAREYIEGNGYELLSENYIDNRQKLDIKCNNGHVFQMSYNKFKDSNCRCTICTSSSGEQTIFKILKDNNIDFVHQHRFDDCKYDKHLPFDFYIPSINLCIEYDGIQHFEAVDFFGGEEDLEKTKLYDSIKNKFCHDKGIRLIRIPYYEFKNLENIITHIIK